MSLCRVTLCALVMYSYIYSSVAFTMHHSNAHGQYCLSFVSKLVERAAVKQLTDYLKTNGLLPLLQSAYRSHHSTETALLKVLSDVLTAIDNKKVTLLALLDLSVAF